MESKSLSSLSRKTDFETLKESGNKSQPCRWMFCVYRASNLNKARVGLTVSRQIGSSVIRNRLKRWCREFLRQKLRNRPLSVDINIVFRPQNADFYKNLKHSELDQKLSRAWDDIVKNL